MIKETEGGENKGNKGRVTTPQITEERKNANSTVSDSYDSDYKCWRLINKSEAYRAAVIHYSSPCPSALGRGRTPLADHILAHKSLIDRRIFSKRSRQKKKRNDLRRKRESRNSYSQQ